MNLAALVAAGLVMLVVFAPIYLLGLGTEPEDPLDAGHPPQCEHQHLSYSPTTGVTRCMECGEITDEETWD